MTGSSIKGETGEPVARSKLAIRYAFVFENAPKSSVDPSKYKGSYLGVLSHFFQKN
jgi:hypothetical protein